MKKLALICLFVGSLFTIKSQELINWMSLQDALDAQSQSYKPIMLDAYTDWCGWCKKMDATTFNHPEIAKLINTNFYAVKFDAEGNDTITFRGKQYVNSQWEQYKNLIVEYEKKMAAGEKVRMPRKPTHDISSVLLNGRMSYPTIVFILEDQNIMPVPGYKEPKDMQPLLIWIGEKANQSCPYVEFMSNFNSTFETPNLAAKNVEWLSFEEALQKQAKDKKKLLIFFEAEWMITNKMMHTSFQDSTVVDYLNSNFHCVKFNAISKETVNAFGQEWKNETDKPTYHPLVSAMLQQNMQFPAVIYLNSDLKKISSTQNFYSGRTLGYIARYYGDDKYLTMKWEEYFKPLQEN